MPPGKCDVLISLRDPVKIGRAGRVKWWLCKQVSIENQRNAREPRLRASSPRVIRMKTNRVAIPRVHMNAFALARRPIVYR